MVAMGWGTGDSIENALQEKLLQLSTKCRSEDRSDFKFHPKFAIVGKSLHLFFPCNFFTCPSECQLIFPI